VARKRVEVIAQEIFINLLRRTTARWACQPLRHCA